MKEINTQRLILRAFRETDYDDLFENLSQLEDDEFEFRKIDLWTKEIEKNFRVIRAEKYEDVIKWI